MTGPDLKSLIAREGRADLQLKVTPKAPTTEWAGRMEDGTYKLKLAAVAEAGLANEELIRFLAREAGVARGNVRILSGATSRRKFVRVERQTAG